MTKRRILVVLAVIALGLGAALAIAIVRLQPRMRAEIVRALERRMNAAVTLEAFDVGGWPRPWFAGAGLTIRHRDRPDLPPLVAIHRFSGDATWSGIFTAELSNVALEGLEITIPPRRGEDMPGRSNPEADDRESADDHSEFGIGRLTTTNARLSIMSKNPAKDPRIFDIYSLEVEDLTLLSPSRFTATLTNPVPEGLIETTGTFGPWDGKEPSNTPLDGQFQFAADLGTIKGIDGALHATGAFAGPADRIVATGTTETPDFAIPKLKGAALPLATVFRAVVDGTNGDVQLESVEVKLANSQFLASGSIVGTKGLKGKRVQLDVTTAAARIEDVLRLTVRTTPPALRGALTLRTAFDLPQGDADVIDKLYLKGHVQIGQARFASDTVQAKVDELSRRAQGKPADDGIVSVPSNIAADFTIDDGTVSLHNIAYAVSGATVAMRGRYQLESGTLDFAGTARLQASVSQTQTGFKHFLLKPFDPLFRKRGAGTRLAIKVTGTVDEPKFGLDLGRTLKGK